MNLLKILSKQKLIIVIFAVCAFSLGLIFQFISKNQMGNISTQSDADKAVLREKKKTPYPVRLRIPNINVDSAVEFVGLTAEGTVDVPSGPETVAWFYLGPNPGEIGSSIIDGHSGYKNNKPGVFDSLHKLKKGDKVSVENSDGAIITFIVREFRRYNPKANAPDVFNSGDEKAHLNLITCTGEWNDEDRTHADRLVVFTDKE